VSYVPGESAGLWDIYQDLYDGDKESEGEGGVRRKYDVIRPVKLSGRSARERWRKAQLTPKPGKLSYSSNDYESIHSYMLN
jgi:hypothetical protein